jgi:cytidyltransferase-like protein
MTNGCFDGGLHAGHHNLLRYCRTLAGINGKVIVCIDTDEKVKKDKGHLRPLFNVDEREYHLRSLIDYWVCDSTRKDPITSRHMVDQVLRFNSNEELYNHIKSVRPDFLVKDSRWRGNVVGEDLTTVRLYDPFPDVSLTKILNRHLTINVRLGGSGTLDLVDTVDLQRVDPFSIPE